MQDVESKDIRDNQHRTGGVRQLAHQFFNQALFLHRHGDIDVVNFARAHIVQQLLNIARPVGADAARFSVMIGADHFITQPRLITEALQQRLPLGKVARHRDVAFVIAVIAQHARAIANKRPAG